jgi:hypothetical protein
MASKNPTMPPILINGHHRVAAAADISPNYLLPVEHSEPDARVFFGVRRDS